MAGSEEIPELDFRDYTGGTPEQRLDFICFLGDSLERFGFVCITGHGIDPEMHATAYALAERLFALPDAVKRGYVREAIGRQRGYTPFGTEHAKDTTEPDLKEFWQIGRELEDDHPLRLDGSIPANLYPTEIPEAAAVLGDLFHATETFANGLLDAIGAYLKLPENTFRNLVHDGNSVLRILHYPPLGADGPERSVRAAQHEDINLLTVMPATAADGLQLLSPDGSWVDVPSRPGVLVCDTGDMMQLLTAGQLPATTHRVVNPVGREAGRSRYSLPFFLHPRPDALLTPIVESDEAPILARDFLQQRLVATGVAPT